MNTFIVLIIIYVVAMIAIVLVVTGLVLLFVGIYERSKQGRKQTPAIITFSLVGLGVIAAVSVNVYKNYRNSVPTVSADVQLWQYDPYGDNTKAVSLDEPSTLILTDNLPRLDGATALYPVYAAFAKAVYPEPEPEEEYDIISCSTTGKAYGRLLDGDTDMIFVSGASFEHISYAEKMGVEMVFTPIGKESFVFFVNQKNPVSGLTTEQIRDIYSGKTTNWRELGGKRQKIEAFQREENSGSQTALVNLMGEIPLMEAPINKIDDMGGMVDVVADYKNYKNAIGYSFLFYTTKMVNNNQIKLLEIDGIAPTRENIDNGTYPHTGEFYAVTIKGNDNPNIDVFIEWILGEQGQYLVEKIGYTPLN